jgi:diacylglycerol kinase family enzyme
VQSLLLVANPSSSQFTGGGHRAVARILSRAYQVEPVWPQSPDHARKLTAQAVADGFGIVAAMGGDGVVHHVAHELAGTSTALAIIPTGTTNVYARLCGIPPKTTAAAKLLVGEHLRKPTPLLQIDGLQDGKPTRRHALFAAGFGFDAEVVRTAEAEPFRKYHFGGLHYARTAIATAIGRFRRRKPHARVSSGERNADVIALLVQFREVYTFFGVLRLSFASNQPSPMTVLVVEGLPGRRIPRIVGSLLTGGDLQKIRGLSVWEGVHSLNLLADPPIWGQADGELTGAWTSAEIRLIPDALSVITPPAPIPG